MPSQYLVWSQAGTLSPSMTPRQKTTHVEPHWIPWGMYGFRRNVVWDISKSTPAISLIGSGSGSTTRATTQERPTCFGNRRAEAGVRGFSQLENSVFFLRNKGLTFDVTWSGRPSENETDWDSKTCTNESQHVAHHNVRYLRLRPFRSKSMKPSAVGPT